MSHLITEGTVASPGCAGGQPLPLRICALLIIASSALMWGALISLATVVLRQI